MTPLTLPSSLAHAQPRSNRQHIYSGDTTNGDATTLTVMTVASSATTNIANHEQHPLRLQPRATSPAPPHEISGVALCEHGLTAPYFLPAVSSSLSDSCAGVALFADDPRQRGVLMRSVSEPPNRLHYLPVSTGAGSPSSNASSNGMPHVFWCVNYTIRLRNT